MLLYLAYGKDVYLNHIEYSLNIQCGVTLYRIGLSMRVRFAAAR